MSLNLNIFPIFGGYTALSNKVVHCFDQLTFDNYNELFCQLRDLTGYKEPTILTNPIPQNLQIIYQKNGRKFIETRVDDNGDELTFTSAKELKGIVFSEKSLTPKNKAMQAYINALPDDIPIILFWH